MHRFGPFEVDFSTSELRRSGSRVRIQEQQLRLPGVLLEQPGDLVSRERLRERLWPSDTFVDFERSLNAAVAKLRQALHDSADRPLYVETVARKGYRFIAPLTQIAGEPEPAAAIPERVAPNWRRTALWTVAVVLCGCAAFFAWAKFQQRDVNREIGPLRYALAMPTGTQIAGPSFAPSMAISPDGRKLALVVSPLGGGPSSIWLRPLGSEAAEHLEGTEGASLPFWSPDGREIGFFAGGQLKRVGTIRRTCAGVVRFH